MDSDEPVHSLQVDSECYCLAWRPNGKRKTEDVDGRIDAARKLKENLTIAWWVTWPLSFKVQKLLCFKEKQIVGRSLICRWWADASCPGETLRKGRRAANKLWNDAMAFHLLFLNSFSDLGILFSFSLISGLWDESIVVWNPLETDKTKQKRILPRKHSDWVNSLSFSPDGLFLASTDEKGKIIIWSTEVRKDLVRCVAVAHFRVAKDYVE